jgi:hypothetical protein
MANDRLISPPPGNSRAHTDWPSVSDDEPRAGHQSPTVSPSGDTYRLTLVRGNVETSRTPVKQYSPSGLILTPPSDVDPVTLVEAVIRTEKNIPNQRIVLDISDWSGNELPPKFSSQLQALANDSLIEITVRNEHHHRDIVPALLRAQRAGLSMAAMPSLSLGQSLELKQEITHSLKLSSFEEQFAEVYATAEKRDYNKHGLTFTYAVVKRAEFPYLLSIGSPGLRFGDMTFVMEDFFVDPKISADFREKLVEMIAVHEYGEMVFGNHHQASLLEFAVAQQEGVLEHYLAFMDKNCFLKFRDIALNRMGPELLAALDESGTQVEGNIPDHYETSEEDFPSLRTAMALRDGFRWPRNLHDRYAHTLDEDEEVVTEKIMEWAKTASAPPMVRPSKRCSKFPTPPEAITGIVVASEMARVSSKS